jgi:hypothetical protein
MGSQEVPLEHLLSPEFQHRFRVGALRHSSNQAILGKKCNTVGKSVIIIGRDSIFLFAPPILEIVPCEKTGIASRWQRV